MKFFAGVRLLISALILMGLGFGLQACSGGGGGSTPAAADQDASGIYTTGSLTVDPSGANTTYNDFVGMIHSNKFMLFSINGHILYEGSINSITLKEYSATVSVYRNGVNVDNNVSVSGTVTTESIFTGTLAGGTNAYSMGSFSVNYDAIYKNVPTFARINGSSTVFTGTAYSTSDLNANYDFASVGRRLVVQTVLSDPGCAYFGSTNTLTIPTVDRNIYEMTNMSIIDNTANCPLTLAGGYSGMATLLNNSVNTTDDKVFVAMTNGTNSVFAISTR